MFPSEFLRCSHGNDHTITALHSSVTTLSGVVMALTRQRSHHNILLGFQAGGFISLSRHFVRSRVKI
jgi:hypothetical protein